MEKQEYNGYILQKKFTNVNSGNGRWAFARKGGEVYFLKEFLKPVYPEDPSFFSESSYQKRVQACKDYEKERRQFYRKLNEASDGNAVRVESFFRCGSKYYMAMKKIHNLNYQPRNISMLAGDTNKVLMCRSLTHTLMKLHQAGIVHADVKWDNLIFTVGKGKKSYVVKLIDFDNSFFVGKQPDSEELGIDPVYCAPETNQYLCGEPITLSGKIDTFALGLLFHQIMTGELPQIKTEPEEEERHRYLFEAILEGREIIISDRMPENMPELIWDMLNPDPSARPSGQEILDRLPKIKYLTEQPKQPKEPKNDDAGEQKDRDAAKKNAAGSWFEKSGDL